MGDTEELYPQVVVYKNALKEPDVFLKTILQDSSQVEKWGMWYSLGRQTMINGYNHYIGDSFPEPEKWSQSRNQNDNYVSKSVAEAFYSSTKDYVERYQVEMQNWSHNGPTINSHTAQKADDAPAKVLAMQHHTDLIMSKLEFPGFKHWLTCNIYINDDYEGGGLSFKVFTNETEYDKFSYSPKAGDALVFPSHHPYYHGVKKTLSGEKFFIRTFWGYEYEGSAEWNKNKELFGQKWIDAEEQRSKIENNSSKWMKGHVEED